MIEAILDQRDLPLKLWAVALMVPLLLSVLTRGPYRRAATRFTQYFLAGTIAAEFLVLFGSRALS